MNKPDPYTQRAAEMFNVSTADVTPEQRAIAKSDFYAAAYGAPSVWHGRMSAPPFKKETPMGDKIFTAMRELLSSSIAFEEARIWHEKGKRKKGALIRWQEFVDAKHRWMKAQNACLIIVQDHDKAINNWANAEMGIDQSYKE